MPGASVIGVDIGGTKILGRISDVDDGTRTIAQVRIPTPKGADRLMGALVALVEDLVDASGEREGLAGIGVGVAGLVGSGGVLRYGPNLEGVVDLDLAGRLGGAAGVPVVVDNDANCAALAEARFGAGTGVSDMVLVTLGTGIGGAIVTDGELWRGRHGFAGEPGHMVVDPHGPECPCGRRGCWERFASGSGLRALARRTAAQGHLGTVVEMAGGDPAAVTGELVVEAARASDPQATAVMVEFAGYVALGLANLVNLFDPEMVVLGGGLVDAGSSLVDPVREAMEGLAVGHGHRPSVALELARLGSAAGAMGAALLVAPGAPGGDGPKG